MKLVSGALLVVTSILALSRVAVGAETFIKCPVQQLEAGVTTQLPAGWWATPTQGPLINTEVMAIGGKKRLVCNYRLFDASVPIMSAMPKGYSVCKAATGGFQCASQGAVQGDGSVRSGGKGTLNPATRASASAPVVTSDSASYEADAPIGDEAPVMEDAGTEYDATAQSSEPAPVATDAAAGTVAGGLIDEEAAKQQVEKFIKKLVNGEKTPRTVRVCGDPAALGLSVRQDSISSTPTKDPNVNVYAFRIEGQVKNVTETAFSSSAGPQSVELYELRGSSNQPRLLASLPFESLAAGETLVIGKDIYKWTTRNKTALDYELRIPFTADECSGKNNIVKLRGSDINNALLGGTP